jgi:hypothetical protein
VIKPLWAITGVTLLGTAGIAGAFVVASSGREEEAVQEVETTSSTPDASVTPTPSPSIASTTIPATSPAPPPTTTPAPAPEGFATYLHAGSERSAPALSFAYPAAWFVSGGGEPPEGAVGLTIILTPWDPRTAPGHGGIPSNSMKVDLHAVPGVNRGRILSSEGHDAHDSCRGTSLDNDEYDRAGSTGRSTRRGRR